MILLPLYYRTTYLNTTSYNINDWHSISSLSVQMPIITTSLFMACGRHICESIYQTMRTFPWQWRHNGREGVSNHRRFYCLLKCLFRHRSKKTSKLRVNGLCEGNSPVTVNSPHKRPVTRKMFSFHDVNMSACWQPRQISPHSYLQVTFLQTGSLLKTYFVVPSLFFETWKYICNLHFSTLI